MPVRRFIKVLQKNEKKVGLRVLYVGPHADVVVSVFHRKEIPLSF
jgi:hypothetical protein